MIAKHLENDLPVAYHETFDVLDSSKIQCFMDCPRKFFFRYVLGWEQEAPNIHFVFGGAWHEAMEHLLLNGYSEPEVLKAYMKFQQYWDENYPTTWFDEQHSSKNKQNALGALKQYAKEWAPYDEEFETLYTEISGTVPISDNILVFVKLDSINRYRDGSIRSLEHKTTGRKRKSWLTKWPSKFQVGTYTHFINVLFPDDADGIIINGAVIRKKSNEFIRIPTNLQAKQMMGWKWEAKHWIDQIRWNFQELAKCKPEDEIMTAFPRNTESCGKFGCPHPELCNLMTNPLRRQDEPPMGFEEEWWDPREREKEAKAVVHLEESRDVKKKDPDHKPKDKTHKSNE